MTQTRAYVSSSYPDLVDYRDAARRLLSQHHIDGRGMEDNDYVANPSLYDKCIGDAASADLVLLIVGFRYGTPLEKHGGKSLVELEYEAATRARRDVRAFLLTDERLPEADDRRGPDGGAAIEGFRRRLVDHDGRQVAYVTDIADFERKCDKLLVEYRRKLLDQRENDPAATAASREQLFLEQYLRDVIERNRVLETFYVPLAVITKSAPAARPWHDPMFGDSAMKAEDEPLEVKLDDAVDALRKHEQFYLAAEPGGGKTLSLIAMETAAAKRYLVDRRRFPLRVDVARWTAEQDFDAFIDRELYELTKVATLPSSQLLLLLDGVIDSAAAPSDPLEKIEAWLGRHERCHAVLAVRAQRALSRKLPVVRIVPLDEERVRQFVGLRLQSNPAKTATLLERLGVGESNRRAGRGFATFTSNPFNLSLICDLELQARLPSNAVALLQTVVALKHARESKKRACMPYQSFVDALGAVAMAMIRNRAHLAADVAWLRKVIPNADQVHDVLALAKDCQVMIEHRAGARYEFRHRLYLEYFAAERLRNHHEMLDSVLEEPEYIDGQRLPRKFDEVIEALVQLGADAEIIETVAAYDPLLGARCLRLLNLDDDDWRSRADSAVVTGLGGLLTDVDAREEAIARLAEIGAPAVTVLRRLATDSRHFVRRSVVRVLAQIADIQAIEAVVLALCDTNGWVRNDAKSTIRRFDARFRELLVQCIRTRIDAWLGNPKTERVVDALVNLIEDLSAAQHEFGVAIAAAAGIDLEIEDEPSQPIVTEWALAPPAAEATTEAVVEVPSPIAEDAGIEEEDDVVVHSASWGRHWQEEWEADRGNPALAAAGRTWLRSTSMRDLSWPFVWSALWDEARTGRDPDLDWLARDWLARTSVTAKSWAYVWQRLFRDSRDEQLAFSGHAWLVHPKIRPEQFGWNYIWRALWDAGSRRDELARIGFWWLETVDANVDGWSISWTLLWEAGIDRKRLEQIGLSWLERADATHVSWGFVWPQLWAALPGDAKLLARGNEWLNAARPELAAWSYIWTSVAATRDVDKSVEQKAWRFVRDHEPAHPAWIHVWEPLWNRNRRDAELSRLAREWLASASPSHGAWPSVWESSWEVAKDDPELIALGKRWIRERRAFGSVRRVCIHLLAHAHGDAELLEIAREEFLHSANDNSHGGFPGMWRVQWDAGGAREWLEPIGRSWVSGSGLHSASFAVVWQALWLASPRDPELRAAVMAWVENRTRMSPGRSLQNVAAALQEALKALPADADLLAVARKALLECPGADNNGTWATLWRIQWDLGGEREWLQPLGREWLRGEGMKNSGFGPVWQRLWADRTLEVTATPTVTSELKRVAIDWLKVMTRDSRWATVAEALAKAEPHNEELLAIAKAIAGADASSPNWPEAWRIVADAGLLDDDLLLRGMQFVQSEDPKHKQWPLVWCRLPVTESQPQSLVRAWALMERTAFGHRLWPEVWEALWERDSVQRPRLAQAAADWSLHVHQQNAERITRWNEIGTLLAADQTRSAAISRVRARLRLRGS